MLSIANYWIVCGDSVRSANLAIAWLLVGVAAATGSHASKTSTKLDALSMTSTDWSTTTARITEIFTRITTYQHALFCHICATQ